MSKLMKRGLVIGTICLLLAVVTAGTSFAASWQREVLSAAGERASFEYLLLPVRMAGGQLVVLPTSGTPAVEAIQELSVEPIVKTELRFTRPFFVGNSLMEGMRLNCGDDYDFCCKSGASIPELAGMLALPDDFDCVVIEVGTNEMGWCTADQFVDLYAEFVEGFGKPCFCVSIPPCNEEKSKYADWVSNENIELFNDCVQEVCERTGSVFLDCSAFFGSALRSDWTGDGLHLTSGVYGGWYMRIRDAVTGTDWSGRFGTG